MESAQKQPPRLDQDQRPCVTKKRPCPPEHPRRGHSGRLTAYFIIAGVCNIFLAIYALYAFGTYVAFSDGLFASGQNATVAETVYGLVLLASPLVLSVLLNRLLFCVMRGRKRRFPRFAGLAACLLIVLVQAIVILILLYTSTTGPGNGFNVDTIARILP